MNYKINYLSFINNKKNILVCPLDWGLGHATRCVPIINKLLEEGHQVIIGADNNPLAFLRHEFPNLKTIVIPGYKVTYDEKGSAFKLFYESVKFFFFVKEEHSFIDKIIQENKIDILISDNRYGLWSKKIKSIIITHQLFVKSPIGEKFAHKKIEKLIRNFDECWIPDLEGRLNLSGDLSHLKSVNHPHKFLGALSRFESQKRNVSNSNYEYDVMAIFSGPEPQRTIFENLFLEQLEHSKLKAIIVRGMPNHELGIRSKRLGTLTFNHLSSKDFVQYLNKSKVVICRSGYSSIMDLAILNKKAILIPTPGQTEQEYLAKYHFEKGNFYMQNQNEFDLEKGMIRAEKMDPLFDFKKKLNLNFV